MFVKLSFWTCLKKKEDTFFSLSDIEPVIPDSPPSFPPGASGMASEITVPQAVSPNFHSPNLLSFAAHSAGVMSTCLGHIVDVGNSSSEPAGCETPYSCPVASGRVRNRVRRARQIAMYVAEQEKTAKRVRCNREGEWPLPGTPKATKIQ